MSTDQLKLAMDAVERRLKAESLQQQQQQQQQQQKKKTPKDERRKDRNGSSFFVGYAPSQDEEENGLAYAQLFQPVQENLLPTDAQSDGKKGSAVDKILHELFQHGDASRKYIQGSKNIKIDNWILLDNYVPDRRKSTGSHIRAWRANSKRSKRHLPTKQHKKLGTLDMPPSLQKYDVFKPMHDTWKDYLMQLLKKTRSNELPKCLLSADLHGAIMLVTDCKIESLSGVSGIMIRETAETFGIITQDDKFKVVPKKGCVFIYQIDCWKITMHGDKLCSRNSGL